MNRGRLVRGAALSLALGGATGCRPARTLPAGTEADAHAAARMLRVMGVEAEVAARPLGAVRVPEAQAESAEATLAAAGFGAAPAPTPTPLVAGPTESERLARSASERSLEATLRAAPDVWNARVVSGASGTAVAVWHVADRPLAPQVGETARAVLGPEVRIVATPVAAPSALSPTRVSLERPLALLALVLAVALGVVSTRRLRGQRP